LVEEAAVETCMLSVADNNKGWSESGSVVDFLSRDREFAKCHILGLTILYSILLFRQHQISLSFFDVKFRRYADRSLTGKILMGQIQYVLKFY
jgi:hypothetical protein